MKIDRFQPARDSFAAWVSFFARSEQQKASRYFVIVLVSDSLLPLPVAIRTKFVTGISKIGAYAAGKVEVLTVFSTNN